ncbi:OmpH family outer membrane protein [Erythrobacter sp. LQ02-29]|uniref:OmpH family outer membrane protein n=1 Tax=unclassified Erythrobacter TaxID=2633097 RepID=UPI001BFC8330|nr:MULTISPECIES: OmpH family outer membrane protein [unclassified Erythrobacter]MCP9223595.1 OmpH family outer membrane protein [Erythrobacter sp. LQ02-29]QWC57719.1 OmpH family outer membrane protein [Erythrobacter sp. 3-20A1M]|tara:strand:+ start:123 stop:803 length:681 start_codon:yes stop_codon:yes gene_type:complete
MKTVFKPLLALGLATASVAALPLPAAAQVAKGVGVVNLPAIVANSQAFQTAQQQRPTTYAAQIQQATTRNQQIEAQLKPLIDKFNADRQGGSVSNDALQAQAAQIQQIDQAGQAEIQRILAPVAASRAYVQEQIQDKLEAAIQAAAKKKNITLVLDSSQGQVVFAEPSYMLSQDVVNELNTLLPTAQLVPPEGWVPREVREQQAQQAAMQNQTGGQQAPQQQIEGR